MGRRSHPVRASGKQISDYRAVLRSHGKTRYRSSSRLCCVSSDFSRTVCRLFLLACKTMYRSFARVWFLVDDHY
ncbi:hypothetical protein TNCV_1502071 [Trichonephila clavipes]|uniref:Uncharacterized protein n=1 Tax=Trichonephila clavipes TaxID=2585209 RepID=A0A8X6RTR4_TRICX|nr:hypothetical protein TNCV_1502071 [Trichonephila clavipes]